METGPRAGPVFLFPLRENCIAKRGKRSSHDPVKSRSYCTRILSGVSPIVTLDPGGRIRYASDSFLKEFSLTPEGVESGDVVEILGLKKKEAEGFRENLESFHEKPIQNCELQIGKRTYGYSIFPVDDDRGVILKDITEIKSLEKRIRTLNSRLRDLQEKERQRIASELHDSVGQTILAAKINLLSGAADARKNERFQTGMELIDRASQELRDIYSSLYPSTLRDLGLEATLEWHIRSFIEVRGIHTVRRLDVKQTPDHEIQVTIYRMIQEISSNIVRHSGAGIVFLTVVSEKGSVRLQVYDDGQGFSPGGMRKTGQGYGLENLRNRADDMGGELMIDSAPGCGTWVEARLPIKPVRGKRR